MQQMQNRVTLIGNLGSDVELKTIDSGRAVARVSLATHEYKKQDDGSYDEYTLWHNIVAWGAKAEAMEKALKKGSYVIVYGRLVHRTYEGKEGDQKNITEIVVREFETPKVKAA